MVEVNGRPVGGLVEFNKLMAANTNNRPTLTVMENGTRRTLRPELRPMTELNRQLLIKRLGLTTQALTETQAAGLQIKAADGLLVTEVEKDSPAGRVQLQAGMVLTAVDASGVGESGRRGQCTRKQEGRRTGSTNRHRAAPFERRLHSPAAIYGHGAGPIGFLLAATRPPRLH